MARLTTALRFGLARMLIGAKDATIPLSLPWQAAAWLDTSFERLTREGYKANAAVSACITTLAIAYQQPRPIVVDVKGEIVPNHPLQRLLSRPNPIMSWNELALIIATYKAIGGNAYLHKVRGPRGQVVELWPYHTGQISPIPGPRTWIDAYEYDAGGVEKIRIDRADIVHLKWPAIDPAQPWLALPPLRLVAREVDTDSEATRYLFALLKNDASPRTIVTSKTAMSDIAYDRFRQQWQERHGGMNRGGLGIIEGIDGGVTRLSLNLQELAFDALRRVPEARICAAFRVPAEVVGLMVGKEHSTYNNVSEARRGLFEDTILQLCALDAAELTADLGTDFGGDVRVEHDTSKVVALQENEDAKYTRALNAWDNGVITKNEARMYLGLPKVEDLKIPALGDGNAFKTTAAPPQLPNVIDVEPVKAAARQLESKQQTELDRILVSLERTTERYFAGEYQKAEQAFRENT